MDRQCVKQGKSMEEIDKCVMLCIQHYANHSVESLHRELASFSGLPVEDIQEKYRTYLRNFLVSELCHLKCVPGFDSGSQASDVKVDGALELNLDPPKGP